MVSAQAKRKNVSVVGRCALVLAIFLAAVLFVACSSETKQAQQDNSPATSTSSSTELAGTELQSANYGMDFEFTNREQDSSYEESRATLISLSDSGSTAEGEGVNVEGSSITITQEGTYIVSGALSNGSLCVDIPDDQKAQIVLNGVTLHNERGAALLVEESDKVFITLAPGSTNALTDGATHEEAEDGDDHNGVIFSHSDLAFNGTGTLIVEAGYANGIVSKDDLVFTEGTYQVKSVKNAIKGKDSVKILDGTFDLDAGTDGIKSSNMKKETKGFVSIEGGMFTIQSGNDAIQAETVLRIVGGEFDITSGDGATGNISTDGGGFKDRGGSNMDDNQGGNNQNTRSAGDEDNESSDSDSAKGLKAGQLVEVSGGVFTMSCVDDTVHSNGSVSVLDGDFALTTDDDGMHADNILNIEGGTIDITKSYEGLEGGKVYIKGGEISVVAVDDGVNAASDVIKDLLIQIEGGNLYVEAASDGLDSNGDINVVGGTTVVYSTNRGVDTAIDADSGTVTISGGIVIAGGPWGGMAQSFDSNSEQSSFVYQASSSVAAGTVMSLVDSSGTVLMTFEVQKSSASLIISSPDLKVGETYSLYEGATLGSDAIHGIEEGGQLGSASKLVEFTLSENSAVVSSNGQVSAYDSNGMGGMMGGRSGGGDRGNMTPPDGTEMSGGKEMPDNMDSPESGQFPEDMEMPNGEPPSGRGGPSAA